MVSEEIFSTDAVSPEPQPEHIIIHRELLAKTDHFLGQLREGDREVFIKRFVDGLSLQSISEETGLSLPALKSRFHRARNRLKETSITQKWGVEIQEMDGLGA